MIKVSVIIPVYNAEKYLKECLNSVLNQTLKDIEVICVNDGSTDNSLNILKDFEAKDERIKVLSQNNSGAAVARNKGLDLAEGVYIAFMDSDDYYPDKNVLHLLYETACNKNALIAGGSLSLDRDDNNYELKKDERFFDKEGFIKFKDYQYDFYYQRFIYSREFLDKNNIRFPLFKRGQDVPFFVKSMIEADKFYVLSRKTYCYREEYKKINWKNNEIALHAIQATSEIIKIAENNNLEKLLNRGRIRLLRYANEILECNKSIEILSMLKQEIENLKINNENNFRLQFEKNKFLSKINFILKLEKDRLNREVSLVVGNGYPAKVSVIIPVYNVEKYLSECLDSICEQSLKNIEIICVNDGSMDSSLNILKDYAAVDERIIVLSQKNGGLSVARNTGINFSHGEYIYFCDSDDKLEITALEELYAKAKNNDLDTLYFNAEAFFESEEVEKQFEHYKTYYKRRKDYNSIYTGKKLFNLMLKNHDYFPAVWINFVNREFLLRNNLIFEPGILHEDNLWSFKCAILARKAGYLPKNFFHRRIRKGSIVTSKVTFANVYGYFITAIKCIEFLKKINLSSDELVNINKLILGWLKNCKNMFNKLDSLEKFKIETLSSYEQILFYFLVINSDIDNRYKKDNKYKKQLEDIRSGYSFRIGRLITFIPRKIRDGINRYKQYN